MNSGSKQLSRTETQPIALPGHVPAPAFSDAERLRLLVVRAEFERVEADLACARYAATLAEIELIESGNAASVATVVQTMNMPGGALANATKRYMAVPVESTRH